MFPFQFSRRQRRELEAVARIMRGRRFLALRPRITAPTDTEFFSRDRTGLLPVRVIIDRERRRMSVRAFIETVERVMFSKN